MVKRLNFNFNNDDDESPIHEYYILGWNETEWENFFLFFWKMNFFLNFNFELSIEYSLLCFNLNLGKNTMAPQNNKISYFPLSF